MTLKLSHTDKVASGLVFVLTAATFYLTTDFPAGYGATGPAFFPRVIVGLMSVFALVQLVKATRKGEPRTVEISRSTVKTVAVAAALVVGYVLTMPYFGFLAGTVVFLLLSMHFSGVDGFRTSIPVSIGVAIALYYIFVQFLRVPLPESAILPISRLLPGLLTGVGLA
ncbi:tripartite tricarboxylate transporter TctB family protein [Halobacterium sp. R2-5]|uniref:tripartite tricarboxylate transporter TctB family protein n=1 Tax=Halobacterium sp. R2-5 TaxID=2715751 RepID=UPI0014212FFF|nr:tripartite tricarboxylate transporter TctB family protein [Halobacterium sp. R2-5]NIC00754.1 tripartite tricarboxylate transporter TctB family protein [Halobacterium sp. R2-5]